MINLKKTIISGIISTFIISTSSSQAQDLSSKSIIFKGKSDITSYKDLENNIESIFVKVQEIRNLKAKKIVNVGIKDSKELNSYLGKMFKDEYKESDIRNDYLTLYHFGLIKKDTDLKKLFLNLYSEQIAGFYDNKSRELYVIDNPKLSELESQIVISHELIHAVQDQYFDLTKLLTQNKNQDAILARMSLVEGEAMLGSVEYISKTLVADGLNSLKALTGLFKNPIGSNTNQESLKNTPGFIIEQMMFPYTSGMKFASFVKEHYNGWDNFSQVYKSPPLSTEQIIHPEKYIAGEKPIEVKINEKIINDKNFTFLKKDTFGEFFLYNYFLEYLDENESEKASYGWGGDISALYADKNNNSIFIYKSAWDSQKDAQEFFELYKKTMNIRFENLKKIQNNQNLFLAKTDKGLIYITIKDKFVNIAEGFNESMKDNLIKYLSKA